MFGHVKVAPAFDTTHERSPNVPETYTTDMIGGGTLTEPEPIRMKVAKAELPPTVRISAIRASAR